MKITPFLIIAMVSGFVCIPPVSADTTMLSREEARRQIEHAMEQERRIILMQKAGPGEGNQQPGDNGPHQPGPDGVGPWNADQMHGFREQMKQLKPKVLDSLDNNVLNPYSHGTLNIPQSYVDDFADFAKAAVQMGRAIVDNDPADIQTTRAKLEATVNQGDFQKDQGVQNLLKNEVTKLAQELKPTTPPSPTPPWHPNQHNNGVPPDCNGPRCLPALDQALAADPNNIAALDARSNILYGMGQLQAANADARQALELDPTDQAALATFKLTEGRADSQGDGLAGQIAQAGTALNPSGGVGGSGAAGLSARPVVLMSDKNPAADNAVQSAQNALRMNDMAAAVSQLNRALAADPHNLDAYRLRAMAYARQGMYDASLRDVEAGLSLVPRDASLFVLKAFDKNRQKDYRAALAAAGMAREIDPDSVDAMANYAYALGGLGQRDQMLDLLGQAAARDARYQASLQDAKNRPVGSDILFLFPGESATGGSAQPFGPEGRNRPSRTRRYGVLAIATVLGGILVALGLLQSVAGPLTKRFKAAPANAHSSTDGALGSAVPGGQAFSSPGGGGELLRNQYKILRQIGSGGMGLVFEGMDVTLSRPVAVKKMRDELRLDRRERMRFINEAKTVAALHHPNIVDIYAIIEEGDELFLVFEFVNGHTVYDIVTRRGALGFKEALGITRGMAAALDYAHGRGIIHRDLKPSNVMVNKEGFVKVMDFGIARMAKDAATRVSMTNTVVGTPPYMAPEQEQGVVRKEADVYSLAICVYEMLCGRVAFAGTGAGMLMNKVNMSYSPISKVVSGLPQGIDLVFARAFQADPDQRFHTAGEFLSALEALPAALRSKFPDF